MTTSKRVTGIFSAFVLDLLGATDVFPVIDPVN